MTFIPQEFNGEFAVHYLTDADLPAMCGIALEPDLFGNHDPAMAGEKDVQNFHWFERRLGGTMVGAFLVDGQLDVMGGLMRNGSNGVTARIAYTPDAVPEHIETVVEEVKAQAAERWGNSELTLMLTTDQTHLASIAEGLGYEDMGNIGRQTIQRFRVHGPR